MSVSLKVCVGSSCHLQGSEKVVECFQELISTQNLDVDLELKGSFCLGTCSNQGVVVSLNGENEVIQPTKAEAFFLSKVMTLVNS